MARSDPAPGPISAVDHVMIATDDVDRGRRLLGAEGLDVGPGGRHPLGTVNALAVSPRRHAYLELISAETDARGELADAVRRGGLVGWAVGVDDLDDARDRLAAAGVDCSPITAGERHGRDGLRIQWRIATIGTGFAQSELPFLIEWPDQDGHRTGMTPSPDTPEVIELRIGSRDPHTLSSTFTALGLDVDEEVRVTTILGEPGLLAVVLRRPDGSAAVVTAGPDAKHRDVVVTSQ